jgi:beta-aspartyl-dipeptidase (metallo-type)
LVYSPANLGRCDLLIAGSKICKMAPANTLDVRGATKYDGSGLIAIPGLIDIHTHILGGGGEKGPGSRFLPLAPAAFLDHGITTVVGMLGFDDFSKNLQDLYLTANFLRRRGVNALCFSGSYVNPPITITGSVMSELCCLSECYGIGELSIDDTRSKPVSASELGDLLVEIYRARLLSGKKCVLHVHLGNRAKNLDKIREALKSTGLPVDVAHLTHINRDQDLFRESLQTHETMDIPMDVTADFLDEVQPQEAILEWYRRFGSTQGLTLSSDSGGSIPVFRDNEIVNYEQALPSNILKAVKETIDLGVPASEVLATCTANPANVLGLEDVGRIAAGFRADLCVVDGNWKVLDVMSDGVWRRSRYLPVDQKDD